MNKKSKNVITELEENIKGLSFMLGATDDSMMQIDYLEQILKMEKELKKLKENI